MKRTYDSLKRLVSATSSASWGETYGYDAFGNLLSKTPSAGSPPTLSQAVSVTNNQITGQTYDANGNQLSAPAGGSLAYDPDNRLSTAPGVQYAYDSNNARVWTGTLSSGALTGQTVFVYGADGQMLGEYSITVGASSLTVAANHLFLYFGTKRIGVTSKGTVFAFSADQLGSSGQYYPYGEAKDGNLTDTWSFATYWRDSATGLDYADQRYSSNQFGRFITPDPSPDGASSNNPQSWNGYSYVLGDPINLNDPSGLRANPVSRSNPILNRRFNHPVAPIATNPVAPVGTNYYPSPVGCDPSDPDCDPGCDPSDPSCNPAPPSPSPGPLKPGPPPPTSVPCSSTVQDLAGALGGTAGCAVGSGPAVEVATSLSDFNSFLQGVGLAPVAGTGGILTIGGVTIGWGEIGVGVGTLAAPEVVISVAAIAGAVAIYEAWEHRAVFRTPLHRLDCLAELIKALKKCTKISDPTGRVACEEAAQQAYQECLSAIGQPVH
jgi:RHS repeat-associated protein